MILGSENAISCLARLRPVSHISETNIDIRVQFLQEAELVCGRGRGYDGLVAIDVEPQSLLMSLSPSSVESQDQTDTVVGRRIGHENGHHEPGVDSDRRGRVSEGGLPQDIPTIDDSDHPRRRRELLLIDFLRISWQIL